MRINLHARAMSKINEIKKALDPLFGGDIIIMR